mgnify:FL=1
MIFNILNSKLTKCCYWKLALIMLISIPVYTSIFLIYNKVNKHLQRKQMEDAAELEVQLVESINASSTIKCFSIESYTNIKTENRFVKLTRTSWQSGITGLTADISSNTFSSIFATILLWLGTTYVIEGIVTPGELMSFHTLTGYFMGPVIALVNANRIYQNAKIAADRLFEIFDLEAEENKNVGKCEDKFCHGDITFEDVTFRYGTREDVLKNLNMKIKAGQVNAIVGESGSGKTTIIALIQKLYDIQKGKIVIGSTDIKTINTYTLRNKIGVVPQKIDLFNGSITDNVILDDFTPNWERFQWVCDATGISDFAKKMPLGLHTIIGENGTQLSGGQRQRIAIARALYKNPEIVILDEATSALDSSSEQNIKNLIRHLKNQKKTIILIAHRLGTVLESDNIFVLDKGILAEQGTHSELINKQGLYSCFWQSQTNTNKL